MAKPAKNKKEKESTSGPKVKVARTKTFSKEGSGTKLVIVESPTKAKTIRKFLGKEYVVESCMGHVRDLPESAKAIPEKFKGQKWANLGVNVESDFEPIYVVPSRKTKVVRELKDKLKDAEELILATDEDREGESISWHLLETLNPKVPVKRMVFHEITREAILEALENFRNIDDNLVRAQEARRILDRLVGYTISPLLWKKVAYGLSAGRVQSVAVRLIAEREHERFRFKSTAYSTLSGFHAKDGVDFESKIVSYKEKKIATGKDFDGITGKLLEEKKNTLLHLSESTAQEISKEIGSAPWTVEEVEEKPISRKPAAPFITSTLQQEANRKLGFASRQTMDVAQKLYERGFITYMRTDSTHLSEQAISAARNSIVRLYGKEYLPETPRLYSAKKVKGAQEAHEAIRPAGKEFQLPEDAGLTGDLFKLYDLIWKRTMASQMVNSEHKHVSAKFKVGSAIFSASGMTIEFPGFLKAYVEGSDDPDAELEDREIRLPKLSAKSSLACREVKVNLHETKPPARFTEASLVQTLEKEGVGRPSTYASIIGTIQDRGYVRRVANALAPTFTALAVSSLLGKHLADFVDLGFTSEMEKSLDLIAEGDLDSIKYLTSIYFGQKGLKKQVETKEKGIDPESSRSVAIEGLEALSFRIGRYGAYVCRVDKETGEEVCASIPEVQLPGDMSLEIANKLIDQKISGADAIGKDPTTGKSIYVLTGRFGPYVQMGESSDEKPKRASIPQGIDPAQVTFPQALELLSMPKVLGQHPGLNKDVKVGIGRFGPYVVCEGDYRSVPKTKDFLKVTLSEALELLAQEKKGRGRAAPLKDLGPHPKKKESLLLYNGKYGLYVKCGKINASLPEGKTAESLTLEEAVELIENRENGEAEKDNAEKPEKAAKTAVKTKSKSKLAKVLGVKKVVSARGKAAKAARRA